MQSWLNKISDAARAAAFVFAACALQAASAHAQTNGADASQPTKTATAAETSRTTTTNAGALVSNPLPANPPAVAPNYAAPARALPSIERVGVEVGEPLTLTLNDAIRMALENNNDIEASRIDVNIAERDLTAARGAYDLRFNSETYFEHARTPVASFFSGVDGGSLKTTDVTGKVGFEGLSPWAGGSYSF